MANIAHPYLAVKSVELIAYPYLIFVTGATGGACVNFFCPV